MRASVALAFLALSGCASDVAKSDGPSSAAVVSTMTSGPQSTVTPVQPSTQNCREFTVPIKVGGEEKQAYGRACEQADGSWQIVPTTPQGQAPTVIEQTNIYRTYDPWRPWGPWWGFGAFGAVGFHHHHHHRR